MRINFFNFKIKYLLLRFSFSFHFCSFFFPTTEHCHLLSQSHLIPPNILLKTMHQRDVASTNDESSKWMRLNHVAWLVFQNLLLLLLLHQAKYKVGMGCVSIILMENITMLMGNWNFSPWKQSCGGYEIILLLLLRVIFFTQESWTQQ